MQRSDGEAVGLTPQESLNAIHATMDGARSSMYVAGTATILLLWGIIVSLGFISQYATETLAPEFAARNPVDPRAPRASWWWWEWWAAP